MLDSQARRESDVPLLSEPHGPLTFTDFSSPDPFATPPPTPPPLPPPYSSLIPPLTLLALLCDYLTLTAIIPIIPLLFDREPQISNTYIFLLFSSKSLLQICANPLLGHLVDRDPKACCYVSPPAIFIASLTVLIMATLGFAYGVELGEEEAWFQYGVLVGCRAIQGLSSSGILSAGMATISLTTCQSSRGGALGTAMIGIAGGVLVGPPLAGVLAQKYTNGLVFNVIAGVGLLSLVGYAGLFLISPATFKPMYCGEEEEEEESPTEKFGGGGGPLSGGVLSGGQSTRPKLLEGDSLLRWSESTTDTQRSLSRYTLSPTTSLLFSPPVLLLVVAVAACNTSVAITEPLIPLFLVEPPFEYETGKIGLVFGVQALAYLFCTPLFGFLSDRRLKTPFMIFGLFCVAGGMSVLLLTRELYVIVIGLVAIGVGIAACDTPSMPLLTLLVPPERFGSAMALQDTAVNVGFLCGPLLAILVGEDTDLFKWLCIAMAGACVLVVPFMGVLLRYEKKMLEIEERKMEEEGDLRDITA